jgi:PAS domain S-box-containing protein
MEAHPAHGVSEDRHAAAFYRTSGELLEVLVPYFKEGLEQGQSCLWLVAPSLRLDHAKAALARAVGDDEVFVRKGQLEFVATEEWYTEGGTFVANRSIESIEKHLTQAAADRYQGLRVSGDTSWLSMHDWARFQDYELQIQQQPLSSGLPIRILCTYSLERCQSPELIEVFCRHDSSVVPKAGRWLHHANLSTDTASGGPLWDALAATLKETLVELDANGMIQRCNQAAETFSGYAQADMLHMPLYFLIHSDDQERVAVSLSELKEGNALRHAPVVSLRRGGGVSPVSLSILPVIGNKRVVSRAFAVFQKLPDGACIDS